MLDEEIDNIAIERLCKKHFTLNLTPKKIIARDIYTSKGSFTTVFEADDRMVYALCKAEGSLVLADIKAIIRRMGMEAEAYLPPRGEGGYFLRHGKHNFLAVFPGRKLVSDEETTFYQTLAPYSPALVRISKIKGEIKEYSPIFQRWQKAVDYSYNRMKVH